MSDDPLLSQAEIDELLRTLRGPDEPVAVAAQPLAVTQADEPRPESRRLELPPELSLLRNVPVDISVELGDASLALGELLQIGRSTLIVLDGAVDKPLLLRVNGVPFARGSVFEVHGKYALRVTEMIHDEAEP